jgi:carboxypeptidase C (cathepsin A)
VNKKLIGLTAAVLLAAAGAGAQDRPPGAGDGRKPAGEPPRAEQSVTQHSISIGGRSIRYDATAGTLLVRNERDEPTASIGYVAYVQRGAGDGGDAGRRPITFAYNGGPGSSSVWLHMGALGPRRIVTADAGPTLPPPYHVVDNAYSILDKTDLVMIDPVGTGLSHAVGEAKDKDFWGVDPDIESISRFITQYVSDNHRWSSPKYLLGESYGTTRAAGVVDYLQTRGNMAFNGVILLSVGIDFEAIFPLPGNDKSYPLVLPSFAATAWYHHALPRRPARLEPFLDEVRGFATGEYASALMKGNALSDPEREAVAEKIHQYTGLSADFAKKANLRIRASQFTQELLRDKHVTLGRLDSRFAGTSFDLLGEDSDYDPLTAAIGAPFTAAFLDYLHSDLKFGQGRTYDILNEQVSTLWDFKHRVPGLPFPLPLPDTGYDLGHAMGYNPNLRVLALNGYYDLATPFLATEYMMSHLPIEKAQQSRIQMKYFEAGHMMYLHEPSLKQLKEAVAAFYDATGSRP